MRDSSTDERGIAMTAHATLGGSKISRHESRAAALSCTCTRDGVLQLASGKYHVRAVLLQPRQLQAEALLNTFLLHNRA